MHVSCRVERSAPFPLQFTSLLFLLVTQVQNRLLQAHVKRLLYLGGCKAIELQLSSQNVWSQHLKRKRKNRSRDTEPTTHRKIQCSEVHVPRLVLEDKGHNEMIATYDR